MDRGVRIGSISILEGGYFVPQTEGSVLVRFVYVEELLQKVAGLKLQLVREVIDGGHDQIVEDFGSDSVTRRRMRFRDDAAATAEVGGT